VCTQSQCLVNVCGDVVLAVYGPETMSVDETPTQPTATATTSHVATADSRMTSTAARAAELNVPEILVHN